MIDASDFLVIQMNDTSEFLVIELESHILALEHHVRTGTLTSSEERRRAAFPPPM